jgi:hypothetical protein
MSRSGLVGKMAGNFYQQGRRQGDVVVSAIATGPKGRAFERGQVDGVSKDDKNPQHSFLRMGSKGGGPMS